MSESGSGSTWSQFTDDLWNLVEDWRNLAEDRVIDMPFLSEHPRTAHGQGLNRAADELGDLLLDRESKGR